MQPQFKTLQIITLALPIGISLFLAVSFLINQLELVMLPNNEQNSVLNYIGLGLAAVSFLISNILFQKQLSKIDTSAPIIKKFGLYTSAYIVRFALLEGAGLFNVVVFLLTGVLLNALIAAAIILFMLASRPQRQKTIDHLKVYYPDTLE
ncbi:hypothetical protein [Mucilaginibacter terrae]|uniref:Uncharacterized protein with PQ loop repeat n=1 Tax=Mucilaginibacter terrae TaxID=1955052 RepID=A0ABU3GUJ9_9SPHI|nr:hypothetical protein [Mucilaginibacter terrae]MDT3403453.1 uncharacterized protein with PQ loop repeat [Mucilaginibacter terrae]